MENNAFSILPHSHPANDRLVRHRWAATVIGAVSLLGMVAAFAVAPATEKTRVEIRTVLDRLPPPAVSLLEAANTRFRREDRVRRGDTIVSLLYRLGITERDALTFLRSDRQARKLAQYLRPGTIVTAEAGANGELHTLEVLAAFLAQGPSEVELQAAKQNLIGSFPLRLDSNRKLLDNVAMIGFYGLPLDYLDRYPENIEKVTAADIQAVFARHVRSEHLVTVVVAGE